LLAFTANAGTVTGLVRHKANPARRSSMRRQYDSRQFKSPNGLITRNANDFIVFIRGQVRSKPTLPRQARSGRDHPPDHLQHKAMFNPHVLPVLLAPPSSGEQ